MAKKKENTKGRINVVPFFSGEDIDLFRLPSALTRQARSIFGGIGAGFGRPTVDIADNGPTIIVTADMPGINKALFIKCLLFINSGLCL